MCVHCRGYENDSVEIVGEAASSFLLFPLFPSAPLLFNFSNISYDITSAICFFVSLVASTGGNTSRVCSCVSSFVTDSLTYSLNFLRPVFS